MKAKESPVNIHFYTGNSSSLLVNCFDEDSEMSVIIRDGNGRKKAIYTMSVSEAKELKDFISIHLKNLK